MSRCWWFLWFAILAFALGESGCWRTTVYAVTDKPAKDASAEDQDTAPLVCQASARQAGNTNETVQVGTVTRSYVLHIPRQYDGSKPVPLIVDFHAIGGSGASELADSPYPGTTDPEGVIMAFPDGVQGPAGTAWNVGGCCVDDVDDVAFAKALVDDVNRLACIDRDHVYAVGLATGGGMAYAVACQADDVFAAVAPAAFDLLKENVDSCNPSHAVTVISFRGTAEVKVPYDGGDSRLVPRMPITFLGAKATFDKWAEIDGCTGSPSGDSNGCSRYSACNDGAEVILCTKQDGREEPGDPSIAWPVLKRHSRTTH